MMPKDEDIDILQNLEFVVAQVWRKHREMTDHAALRAYDAVFEQYRAEERGHTPKPCTLTGLEGETFEGLQAMCEYRLGRKPLSDAADEPIEPVSLERLVDCLRRLRKSVERHTKHGGRQSYLTFIDRFVP